MPSKRESILAYIDALLKGDGGVGAKVFRSRQAALAPSEGSAVIIEPVMDQPRILVHQSLDWTLSVAISVITRGAIPDQIADPIIAEIHRRVTTNPTLGGYAYDVQSSGSSFDMISADRDAAIITNSFDVQYRTSDTDITL